MKLPRMSLHIGDYLKDTSHLDAEGHGAYLLLIMHYWAKGGLPDDDKQLAMVAKMTKAKWKKIKPTMQGFFGPNWIHKRIDQEMEAAEDKYEKRVKAGKKSAELKWGDGIGRRTRSQRLADARAIATHTEEEWMAMLAVFGGCVKCDAKNEDVFGGFVCKDHITAIFHGGSDGIENIQPLCRSCNSKKSYSDRTDYRDMRDTMWRKRLSEGLAKCVTDARQPLTLTPSSKEEEKDSRSVASATRPGNSLFDRFKQAYPKRDGPNPWMPAAKKFMAFVKSGIDPEEIIGGAERYAKEMRGKGQERTPYVAQAQTWLNQQRWCDYPASSELTLQNHFENNGKVINGARSDSDRTISSGFSELKRELLSKLSNVVDMGHGSSGSAISLVPKFQT